MFASTYREGSKTFETIYYRVPNGVLSMLEPCEVKVSRRVLRGEGSRKAADLPGGPHRAVHEDNRAVAGSR